MYPELNEDEKFYLSELIKSILIKNG